MKEIGEKLKNAREEIGISIEEVADDLKMKVSQVESVENGNMEAFKDIFSLKYFIRDYSKYLGLEFNEMVDEFNEYLFDYTSKISIKEIKAAKNEEEGKKEPKISSPYTNSKQRKRRIPPIIMWILLVVGLIILFCFIIFTLKNSEAKKEIANNIININKF